MAYSEKELRDIEEAWGSFAERSQRIGRAGLWSRYDALAQGTLNGKRRAFYDHMEHTFRVVHDAATSGDRRRAAHLLMQREPGFEVYPIVAKSTFETANLIGQMLDVGTVVYTKNIIDRWPSFQVAAGQRGVVKEFTDESILVKMDQEVDGAEEWENCVIWQLFEDNYYQFWFDVRLGSSVANHIPLDFDEFILGWFDEYIDLAIYGDRDSERRRIEVGENVVPHLTDMPESKVVPLRKNPKGRYAAQRASGMKRNPGEPPENMSWTMKAGRMQGVLDWDGRMPLSPAMRAELETASDALETGDKEQRKKALKILLRVEHDPWVLSGDNTSPKANDPGYEEWLAARTALVANRVVDEKNSGDLVLITRTKWPDSDSDIGMYMEDVGLTYRDALAGMHGYRILDEGELSRIHRKDSEWHDYLIGYWMAVIDYQWRLDRATPDVHERRSRYFPKKKNPSSMGDFGVSPYVAGLNEHSVKLADYWARVDVKNAVNETSRWLASPHLESLRLAGDAFDHGRNAEAIKVLRELPATPLTGTFPLEYWNTPKSKADADTKDAAIRFAGRHIDWKAGNLTGWEGERAAFNDYLLAYWMIVLTMIGESAWGQANFKRNGAAGNNRHRDDAIDMYKTFWRLEPRAIGEFATGFKIPTRAARIGEGHSIMYRSAKTDPETLKRPKKPVDYIHHFNTDDNDQPMNLGDDGVHLYAPGSGVIVPSFITEVQALTLLGDCLGWEVEIDGERREAKGVKPLPELYAIPSGKALLVIQDKRDVLAIFWGGDLSVEGRGIVH